MDLSNIDVSKGSLGALANALKKTSVAKTNYSKDDEWSLFKDQDGNGNAKIRFVPSPDGELFVEVKTHGFKNNSQWYIDPCPKTLGWEEDCPVCDHANGLVNNREWKTISESEQKSIKKFFGKTSYWANVYIEKDPANPENEGKVFKYRFGKKILEKIIKRAQDDPLDEEIKGINVFDVVTGASFKLSAKNGEGGWTTYDDSSWALPTALLKGKAAADKMDDIVKAGHKLVYMNEKEFFPLPEDAAKKLAKVLGRDAKALQNTAETVDTSVENDQKFDQSETEDVETSDADKDFDYFRNLANEV